MYRNWSAVPQMSPPPACTDHVPPDCVCVPAGVGAPMSEHVNAAVQIPDGSVEVEPIATDDTDTVLKAVWECDVTATPPRKLAPKFSATVDPGTWVHVVPSLDVIAV